MDTPRALSLWGAKMPKYNGGSASTYLFGLVCFYIGLAVVTAVSLGLMTCDEREGAGFNPFTRMPDWEAGHLGVQARLQP